VIDLPVPNTTAQPTPATPTRVLLVEDQPVVRDGLAQLLGASPNIAVVAAVGERSEVLPSIEAHKPDVVLQDLMLGGCDCLDLITEQCKLHKDLRVLVFSMMNEAVFAERALRAGAQGYIMKSSRTDELLLAIRSVMEGRIYLSPRIFVSIFRGLLKRSSPSGLPGAEGLSDRELQIFQLIGGGSPNRQIALQLGISVKTVETHRENLKAKLGIQDSTDLLSAAQVFVSSLVR
jgi:DNA-binding NarL/FixJ family response regulator